MRNPFTLLGIVGKAGLLAALLLGAVTRPAAAQTVYGLTLDTQSAPRLVTFSATAPGTFLTNVPITGLGALQALVGLDVRPATGQLYAQGIIPSSGQSQLYTLNPATGQLTPVSGLGTQFSASGTQVVGFDFDPTTDRIRVTSGSRANGYTNPVTGLTAYYNTLLAYANADPNTGQVPAVGSWAHTNSPIGGPITSTTLYGIDHNGSRLVTLVPPSAGLLRTQASLSVPVTTPNYTAKYSDLDIGYVGGQNVAYLSVATDLAPPGSGTNLGADNQLYTLNLSTGAATPVGQLGTNAGAPFTFVDLAVVSDQLTLPAVTGQLVYALAGPYLLTFDSAAPGTIRSNQEVMGLDPGMTLVGLDVRPATNVLYALGYDASAPAGTNNARLFTPSPVSGMAGPYSTLFRLELGTGSVGFDFDPVTDRIRVVGANGNSYRLDPTRTASTVATAEAALAYAAGSGSGTPSIGALAYTNSFAGATSTVAYSYDEVLNQLNTHAAGGQLTRVGASGLTVNNSTPTAINVDLDIYSTGAGVNTAYLVANTGNTPAATDATLYTVSLSTGQATARGLIGSGWPVRDIAVTGPAGASLASRPAAAPLADLTLYPNPLRDAASLSFVLARPARAELVVSDLLGRTLATVDAGQLGSGPQAVRWTRGTQAAGLYYLTLRLDGQPAATRTAVVE